MAVAKPIFLFPHIPKTAGQSLRRYLNDYLDDARSRLLAYDVRAAAEDAVHEAPPERLAALDVIIGHRVTSSLSRCFPGRPVRPVTLLREPIDLVISRFNYERRGLDLGDDRAALGEFENWFRGHNRNPQTRWLLRVYAELNPKRVAAMGDDELWDRSQRVLEEFWLTGCVERIEPSLRPLFDALGASRPFDVHSNRAGTNYPKQVVATASLSALIESGCSVDRRAYERFCRPAPV